GKSNIVDAIRWCMGEQSAKHLRGQAMGDVIFNGSDSRGPAGMAEVSLTFEEVGFSQETLNLPLDDEAGLQDPLLAVDRVGTEGEAEADTVADPGPEPADPVTDAEDADAAAPVDAPVAARAPVADGGEEAPADPTEATRDVAEFLADRPPDIDFSRYS